MPLLENDSVESRAAAMNGPHGIALSQPPRIIRLTPLTSIAGIAIVAAAAMVLFCETPGLTLVETLAVTALTIVAWYFMYLAQRAVTARSQAENDLRESEERLRLATESAGIGTSDLDLLTGEAVWSDNRFQLFGYPPRAGGRARIEMWLDRIHPDDLDRVMREMDTARRQRSLSSIEHRVIRADDGRIVWLRAFGRYHYDGSGQAVRFTSVSFDNTVRKHAELNDQFLFRLDERLRQMSDADAIIDEAIRSVGEYLNVTYCRFGERNIQEATDRIRRGWSRAGAPALAAAHRFGDYITPECRAALDAGHAVVIRDVRADQRTAVHAEVYAALGVAAFLIVPYIRKGQCQGKLGVFAATPREWRNDEVKLLHRVLGRIWPLAASARATQALRDSERRERERAAELETLLEAVPAMVLIAHDAECRRITGNRAAKELLRLDSGEQASLTAPDGERPKHFKVLVNGRELADSELPVQRAARGFAATDFEESILFSDGTVRHLLGNAVPLRDDSNRLRGAVAAYVDITERRPAERAQAQLAAIVESNSDAIIGRSVGKTIYSWNPAAERLFGWTAREAIGQSIRITTPPETWGMRDAIIERVARGAIVESVETVRVHKNGARFFAEVTYSPVKDAQDRVVSISMVIRDITARKQAEQVLREYTHRVESMSRELLRVQENERVVIARELHDQIGQALGAAKLRLQMIRRQPSAQPFHDDLDEVVEALSEALQETRTLALRLRPPQLDDLGLARAMRLYAERLAGTSQMKLHFPPSSLPVVPTPLDIACFRVAQEALQNIIRHAAAENVWIDLSLKNDMLHLTVRDDGKGCDLAAVRTRVRQGHSMGLLNMEERVTLAGGSIEVLSRPGQGTTIHAAFPLSQTTARAPQAL
jgi:two-component system sensor histidine kinase UhpB